MLKISIIYIGGLRPLSLTTNEYPTISDFLKRWITDPANNIMMRASDGGVLISKRDIETLTLDDGNKTITLSASALSGLSLEYAVKISEGNEKMGEVIPMAYEETNVEPEPSSDSSGIPSTPYPEQSNSVLVDTTEIQKTETKDNEMVAEAVVQDNQEVVTTTDPIPVKAQNFREKFLDRETKADAFENTIIEKMDRRIAKLENFAKVLDGENDYLDEFTAEKLGQ